MRAALRRPFVAEKVMPFGGVIAVWKEFGPPALFSCKQALRENTNTLIKD